MASPASPSLGAPFARADSPTSVGSSYKQFGRRDDETNDEEGFVPSRKDRNSQRILPHSAFLAPKKPPAGRNSLRRESLLNQQHADASASPMSYGSPARPETGEVSVAKPTGSSRTKTGMNTSSSSAVGSDLDAKEWEAGSSTGPRSKGIINSSSEGPFGDSQHQRRGSDWQSSVASGQSQRKLDHRPRHPNGGVSTSTSSGVATSNPTYPPSDAKATSQVAINEKPTNRQRRRIYQTHKGGNRFFLGGRLITADSNPLPFLGSLALLVVLGGLWLGFESNYLWHHLSPAVVIVFAYLWSSSVVNMLVTATTDPGILPRDLDPTPAMGAPPDRDDNSIRALDPEDPLYTPLPRILRCRNGQDLTTRWCETCKIYRPPRSSHCRVCDGCMDSIDHHCTYLNTCVARRNYAPFIAFLSFSILSCLLGTILCAIHLWLLTRGPAGRTFQQALQTSPMSAVLFLLILAALFPLVTLFSYHTRLMALGRSTAEQIRLNTLHSHRYSKTVPSSPEDLPWKTMLFARFLCCSRLEDLLESPFAKRRPWINVKEVLFRPSVGVKGYVDWTALEEGEEGLDS